MIDGASPPRVCPYCGQWLTAVSRCDSCNGRLDRASLEVTRSHLGPWYVRDTRHPHKPGCSFDVLRRLAARGSLHRESVVRGPTTGGLWRLASETRGVSALVGCCWSCGGDLHPAVQACHACGAQQQPLGAGSEPTPSDAPRALAAAAQKARRQARRTSVLGVAAIALLFAAGGWLGAMLFGRFSDPEPTALNRVPAVATADAARSSADPESEAESKAERDPPAKPKPEPLPGPAPAVAHGVPDAFYERLAAPGLTDGERADAVRTLLNDPSVNLSEPEREALAERADRLETRARWTDFP